MQTRSRKTVYAIFATGLIASSLISCGGAATAKPEATAAASAEQSKASSEIQIGQILKTEYFDITVNKAKTARSVKVDGFQDLQQEAGNKYLVLELTLKNTDNESRLMFDGTVIIKANGQEYKYEEAETILSEGWGMIMDNINPLVTKKTKLVYKIPDELKGTAYYNPARSDADEVINLGNIE